MAPQPAPAPNAWSTGLCDCCAEPGGCTWCLYATCCPCCAYGSNMERIPPVVCCGGQCVGSCLLQVCLAYLGVPCVAQMMSREWIRNKYNIPGDLCTDFMITWCCSACALCQEHRELVLRGCEPGNRGEGPATAAPQQMVMVPITMQPQPGYAPQPQPGYAPQPQPGYAPQPQPGYAPQPQPGYAPQPQPGYAPQPQPGYAPQPQPGYAPQPQPGFPALPPPTQPGFPAQPQLTYYPPVPPAAAAPSAPPKV